MRVENDASFENEFSNLKNMFYIYYLVASKYRSSVGRFVDLSVHPLSKAKGKVGLK